MRVCVIAGACVFPVVREGVAMLLASVLCRVFIFRAPELTAHGLNACFLHEMPESFSSSASPSLCFPVRACVCPRSLFLSISFPSASHDLVYGVSVRVDLFVSVMVFGVQGTES